MTRRWLFFLLLIINLHDKSRNINSDRILKSDMLYSESYYLLNKFKLRTSFALVNVGMVRNSTNRRVVYDEVEITAIQDDHKICGTDERDATPHKPQPFASLCNNFAKDLERLHNLLVIFYREIPSIHLRNTVHHRHLPPYSQVDSKLTHNSPQAHRVEAKLLPCFSTLVYKLV